MATGCPGDRWGRGQEASCHLSCGLAWGATRRRFSSVPLATPAGPTWGGSRLPQTAVTGPRVRQAGTPRACVPTSFLILATLH